MACNISEKTDLVGLRLGHMTVIRPTDKISSQRSRIWECRCDCGNIFLMSRKKIRSGKYSSCGCRGKHYGEHGEFGQKWCHGCKKYLPESEFCYRRSDNSGTRISECRECVKSRSKEYVDTLSSHYIRKVLMQNGFLSDNITPDIIEIKRAQLRLQRVLSEANKELDNGFTGERD